MNWQTVSRIRKRLPLLGKPIAKLLQVWCGITTKHKFGSEWGYGGGDYADAWCEHCNHYSQIHKESLWFKKRMSKDLMDLINQREGPWAT